MIMHYVVRGAPGTPYEGGVYHGKLVFPSDFPFKPPAIYMLTPSGRFQTNTRLCLSISDYHPDTWNPAWTVSTILTGLLSFMNENSPTLGSIQSTDAEKRAFCRRSRDFNLRDKAFCELFSELAEELRQELAIEAAAEAESAASQTEEEPKNRSNNGDLVEHSITYNLLVLAGVVALAFAVRYVILAAQGVDSASP
uniref:UBC core domain-containing protein n=1 Tax=Plectus sambesii TaxID=2011161 RepID=A0A914VRJ0_9BILA